MRGVEAGRVPRIRTELKFQSRQDDDVCVGCVRVNQGPSHPPHALGEEYAGHSLNGHHVASSPTRSL